MLENSLPISVFSSLMENLGTGVRDDTVFGSTVLCHRISFISDLSIGELRVSESQILGL